MPRTIRLGAVLTVLCCLLAPALAWADAAVFLDVIRMDPYGRDARGFSRPGWGAGLRTVIPLPQTHELLSFVGGLDAVNLLSDTQVYYEGILRVEQQTSQNYGRLYLGGQFGPRTGAVRPHVEAAISGVWYGISSDAVVPDDTNVENEIRQHLDDQNEYAFGYHMGGGLEICFKERFSIDANVRYLESFGVPQQLGLGAVTIQPQYFQYSLGIGLSFGAFRNP